MTRISIVEDNRVQRETFRSWIQDAPGHECVCACATAEEALVEIPAYRPHVVLMDVNLPGLDGIVATARLKEKLPGIAVIMLTVYRDPDKIFDSLKAGACGYLLKRSTPEQLLEAIAEVRSGGAPMSSEIARRVVEAFHRPPAQSESQAEATLSDREKEILDGVSRGLSNKEIGVVLNITDNTVASHLKRIYERLHVRSRTEAAMRFNSKRQKDFR
jgi:DNA-binding NarL/FixJ family response regulator